MSFNKVKCSLEEIDHVGCAALPHQPLLLSQNVPLFIFSSYATTLYWKCKY